MLCSFSSLQMITPGVLANSSIDNTRILRSGKDIWSTNGIQVCRRPIAEVPVEMFLETTGFPPVRYLARREYCAEGSHQIENETQQTTAICTGGEQMVISKVAKWITAICLVLFLHNVGFAQAVNNAQVHGTVLDQSGAAVVGAKVTATQKETGQVQATVSGADGSFVLPGLPVGGYSLQVTANGFRKYTQTGLVLQVGQNVQVNIPLTVGSVSQEVQVSADAAMVETQDTSNKLIGLNGAYAWKKATWTNVWYGGPERDKNSPGWRNLFDSVVQVNPNDNLSLYLNFDYGRNKNVGPDTAQWTGIAGAARRAVGKKGAITGRVELFDDVNGFSTGLAQTVKEFTLTGEYKFSGWLLSRLEFRDDWSSQPFFEKGQGDTSKNQPTVLLGMVAYFGPKK